MREKIFHNKNMHVVLVADDGITKYCPPKEYDNTNLHPRVALKFINGQATCPYCGANFKIKTKET